VWPWLMTWPMAGSSVMMSDLWFGPEDGWPLEGWLGDAGGAAEGGPDGPPGCCPLPVAGGCGPLACAVGRVGLVDGGDVVVVVGGGAGVVVVVDGDELVVVVEGGGVVEVVVVDGGAVLVVVVDGDAVLVVVDVEVVDAEVVVDDTEGGSAAPRR
jgi:hypothetical protein